MSFSASFFTTNVERLFAFDPGGTTGWCCFEKHYTQSYWTLTAFGQFPVEDLVRIPEIVDPESTVLYEQIQVLHLGFDPVGLQVIGALKLWCAMNQIRLLSQSPGILSGAKVWPELNDARKWFRNAPHAKDAFYHGVTKLGLDHIDLKKSPLRTF